MKAKGKVSGKNYVAANEEYKKKMVKKESKGMSTAGMAKELKLSEKEMGYGKIPKLKGQKKGCGVK